MESRIVYFEDSEANNTEETFRIVKRRADELGIKTVLVASTFGDTAVKAVEMLKGLRVIAISHTTGYKEQGIQQFTEKNRKIFESKGGILFTGTRLFAGLSMAMRTKYNMYVLGEIISDTLRLFGHGLKVVCEMAPMAADAGLVRTDEDIIAVAGTSHGADSAAVLTPVNSQHFFDLKIKEILCKPHF